jgi:glycerophosphoryl diester phosphodiesterase
MLDLGSKCLNIAHRGARSLAPENTLAAADVALKAGADMWELDVNLARDGQPVVLHDQFLARTSNAARIFPGRQPWRVRDFSLEEIQTLDFGTWFVHSDPFGQIRSGAVSKELVESYPGQAAPTLLKALEFTKAHNWLVNLEIKDQQDKQGDSGIAAKVTRMVQDVEMSGQVLISSFNHQYLKQVHALAPQVALGALVDRILPDPLTLLEDIGAQAVHARWNTLSAGRIKALSQKGIKVLVWTVNQPAQMQAYSQAGAAGIITDFPQLFPAL